MDRPTMAGDTGGAPGANAGPPRRPSRWEPVVDEADRPFLALVQHSYDPVVVVDEWNNMLYAAPSIQQMFGFAAEELVGRNGFEYLHPDDLARAREHGAETARRPGARVRSTVRLRHRDGTYRWIEVATVNLTRHPEVGAYVHNYRDVTEQKEAEDRARSSEARLRSLVANADGAIVLLDDAARLAWASPGAERLWGLDRPALSALTLLRRVHPDARRDLASRFAKLVASPAGSKIVMELRMRHADRSWRWYEGVFANCLADPAVGGVVVNVRDTTERMHIEQALRDSEAELEFQATHDPLTGLPNRTLLFDRLQAALAALAAPGTDGADGAGPRDLAVLFCDLDNFKFINDSHGHAMGDELLREVALRLGRCLRPGDVAARFGGDEFIVVAQDLAGEAAAAALGEQIIAALRGPFPTHQGDMYVTASVGIALAGTARRELTVGDLLRDADAALYAAKEKGRNRVETFDSSMRARATRWHRTERALRGALARDEMEVHYQPIVDLRSGAVSGVEALVRWHHPERGVLTPAEFIGVAEQTGLVIQLGSWVFKRASALVAELNRRSGGPALALSVNLSTRQLSDESLTRELAEAINASRIDPHLLTVEVTESGLMRDVERSILVLHRLKALGVRVAIDDFGTGHSSFSYLGNLPVDVIKIDRSFVVGLDGPDQGGPDAPDRVAHRLALVEMIINLGHVLDLQVVAEGVETERQADLLASRGCDFAQGYQFGRALDEEHLSTFLAGAAPY